MTGFLVFDYAKRYPEAIAQLAAWRSDGLLHTREDIVHGGIDQFPEALLRLFRGENVGKLILQLDGSPS